ncbi:MAG: MscL family protein [Erysipelotrichaceae bacterium]|nr:MscL family protein [Erysipelotrichaceae bacterium]
MKKEKKIKAPKKPRNKETGFWAEFKKFIKRGNAVDMAVGVVIGGAFNAIVTALVGILLSISTWGVPGGLKGLVTILPALNPSQTATTVGWQDSYSSTAFADLAAEIGKESSQKASLFMASYTQRGNAYYYNGCAIIDWGSFINAVITFIIIALTLFVIIKVYNYLQAKRAELEKKIEEDYYKKHPEERPVPVEAPIPAPTEVELLTEIRDVLKKQDDDIEKISNKI